MAIDDEEQRFATDRAAMVADQIARRGITNPAVLGAMGRVPRHLFVPAAERHSAYADRALPIGGGQTISQPYMVAAMTEALRLLPDSRVLEIGTGSGYQAAVLASIAGEVLSIERRPELADGARERLAALGFRNARVLVGDGSGGYPAEAPYDAILVTAGAPRVPETLTTQLVDGGRLVVPVGVPRLQELVIVERVGNEFRSTRGESCVFVPLIGREGWEEPSGGGNE